MNNNSNKKSRIIKFLLKSKSEIEKKKKKTKKEKAKTRILLFAGCTFKNNKK